MSLDEEFWHFALDVMAGWVRLERVAADAEAIEIEPVRAGSGNSPLFMDRNRTQNQYYCNHLQRRVYGLPPSDVYCRSQASDMPSEWPPSGVTPGRPSTNQLHFPGILCLSLSLARTEAPDRRPAVICA